MAAITMVPLMMRPLIGAVVRRYPAASVNVGVQSVVYVTTAGAIELADADAVASAQARGIVVAIGTTGKLIAAVGDMCDVVVFGPVETGAAGLTDGAALYVSVTAGALDHTASVTTGDFNYVFGYAEGDTVIFVQPQMVVPVAV